MLGSEYGFLYFVLECFLSGFDLSGRPLPRPFGSLHFLLCRVIMCLWAVGWVGLVWVLFLSLGSYVLVGKFLWVVALTLTYLCCVCGFDFIKG